jgi:hypothetical protein
MEHYWRRIKKQERVNVAHHKETMEALIKLYSHKKEVKDDRTESGCKSETNCEGVP